MDNKSSTASKIWNTLVGSRNNNNMSPSSSTESDAAVNSSPVAVDTSTALVSKPPPEEEEGGQAATASSPTSAATESRSAASADEQYSATAHYKFADIQIMTTVTKSPYEPNQSAEVGEPLFERLKLLLLSREERQGEVFEMAGAPTLTVQKETKKIFGEVLADSVVKAYYVIGKSGMLFSPPWLENKQCKIRGIQCGWITKPMMLLLLQDQRFARAPDATLNSLINSIGVISIFFDALKEWNLEDPRLVSNEPSLHFASKKPQCMKCVIFVARVYQCSKSVWEEGNEVDFKEEEPGLFAKVQQCLEILKQNVKVNPKRLEEYESTLRQENDRKQYLLNLVQKENSRRLQQKPEKKRKRASGPLTVQSTGSSLSSRTFRDTAVLDVPAEASMGGGPQPGMNGTQSFPEDADPPAPRQAAVEELLKVSEMQLKLLKKSIKKMGSEIQKSREEIEEEMRVKIMREFGLDPNSSARRTSSSTKKKISKGKSKR
jgi:hypothetical protein